MASVANMITRDFSRCNRVDEERMPLHLTKATLTVTTQEAVPSSAEFNSRNTDDDTIEAMTLSMTVEEDLFHVATIADHDSCSEHSEILHDDDLSISAFFEIEESKCRSLRSSHDSHDFDRTMKIEDETLLEPLDYRVPLEPKGTIQSDCDWELMRPALMRIMYSK